MSEKRRFCRSVKSVSYDVKGVVIFVKCKAKIFSIAVAMVKFFNAVIGKKYKSWYVDNMLDLTLRQGDKNDAMQRIVRLLSTQPSCKRLLCSQSHTPFFNFKK